MLSCKIFYLHYCNFDTSIISKEISYHLKYMFGTAWLNPYHPYKPTRIDYTHKCTRSNLDRSCRQFGGSESMTLDDVNLLRNI